MVVNGKKALAVIGVARSLMSAYYHSRVVVTMYMREAEPETTSEPWWNLTWGSMAVLTVLVSLVPAPLFSWASHAVLKLFQGRQSTDGIKRDGAGAVPFGMHSRAAAARPDR